MVLWCILLATRILSYEMPELESLGGAPRGGRDADGVEMTMVRSAYAFTGRRSDDISAAAAHARGYCGAAHTARNLNVQ